MRSFHQSAVADQPVKPQIAGKMEVEAEAELEAGGGSGGKGPSVQLIRLCSGRTMISLKYYSSITKNDISKPKRRRNQLS